MAALGVAVGSQFQISLNASDGNNEEKRVQYDWGIGGRSERNRR